MEARPPSRRASQTSGSAGFTAQLNLDQQTASQLREHLEPYGVDWVILRSDSPAAAQLPLRQQPAQGLQTAPLTQHASTLATMTSDVPEQPLARTPPQRGPQQHRDQKRLQHHENQQRPRILRRNPAHSPPFGHHASAIELHDLRSTASRIRILSCRWATGASAAGATRAGASGNKLG